MRRVAGDALSRSMLGYLPGPLRLTFCGLSSALSSTDNSPVRWPVERGENAIWTVQVAFGPSGGAELLQVDAGSARKSPVTSMAEMFSISVPVFVTTTVFGELSKPICCSGKVNDAGEIAAVGFPAVPEPFNVTTSCVLLAASRTVSVPELGAIAEGLKVTIMSQAACKSRVAGGFGQSSVSENSPVTEMLLTGCGDPPLLKTITDCGPLGFPTRTLANSSE